MQRVITILALCFVAISAAEAAPASTPGTPTKKTGAIVILGGTGDLSRRKLIPGLLELERRRALRPGLRIVVTTSDSASRESVLEMFASGPDGKGMVAVGDPVWRRLAARIVPVRADVTDANELSRVKKLVTPKGRTLFYYALPPSIFGSATAALARAGVIRSQDRVIIEKPFGHDARSSAELSRNLTTHLTERQVMRVDHYLGKEGLAALRRGVERSSSLRRALSPHNISSLTVRAVESLGVSSRGKFYDQTGATRDMVQSHLLQMFATVASLGTGRTSMRRSRHHVMQQRRAQAIADLMPVAGADIARGQLRTYLGVDGVAPNSSTETYVAMRAESSAPGWQGVPIIFETGKGLKRKRSEVRVGLRRLPVSLARRLGQRVSEPAEMLIGLDPTPTIKIRGLVSKRVVKPRGLHRADALSPYAWLLGRAIRGREDVFVSSREIAASWKFIDNVRGHFKKAGRPQLYRHGRRPSGARGIVTGAPKWRH